MDSSEVRRDRFCGKALFIFKPTLSFYNRNIPTSLNYVPRKQLIATVYQLSMLTQMGLHSKRQ